MREFLRATLPPLRSGFTRLAIPAADKRATESDLQSAEPKVAYLTRFVGEYHAPRLAHLSAELQKIKAQLTVAQFNDRSRLYSHTQAGRKTILESLKITKFRSPEGLRLVHAVWRYLVRTNPHSVLVLGYSDAISLTSLVYAKLFRRSIFFLSDSKADDQPRKWITERIKAMLLRLYDGALVAGKRHSDYFRSLGFRGPIETGFDVVDNRYFFERAQRYSRKRSLLQRLNVLPEKYVLCVSRLVPRKRIDRALQIFELSKIAANGYKLVIIGDGPGSAVLTQTIEQMGLTSSVVHRTNVANSSMPAYYCNATAIILASEYDQWGLCVNEAMACGVPPIVSFRCGVATEIVHAKTGIVFHDDDLSGPAAGLRRMATDPEYKLAFTNECIKQMRQWDLGRFSSAAINLIGQAGKNP